MENTIELIKKQHEVLVNTIIWLDNMKYSNTRIRKAIDHILNHSEDLVKKSEMELTKISWKGEK